MHHLTSQSLLKPCLSTVINCGATVLLLIGAALTDLHSIHAGEVVGPIVGTVESTTAHVLYRPGTAESKWQLSVLTDGRVVQRITALSQSEHDYVAKFAVNHLKPGTQYRYQIEDESGRVVVPADEQHSFTTANPARANSRASVSFVSCVDIEPNAIWQEMANLDVDGVFLMGDT
ncbi:MAG: hypothetical protein KDA91_23265, partial [Planctomycetaceae bacterium]|nr:hypothetical protein [Planctomycetaceae bacterium]